MKKIGLSEKMANPKSTGLSMCCTDEHIAILFIVHRYPKKTLKSAQL